MIPCPACSRDVPDGSPVCPNCGTELPTTEAPHTQSYHPSKSPPSQLAPGQLLAGRYRLTARLGAGGMGEVYRATDETLGRSVAIKVVLAPYAASPAAAARFEREARLLAALNHPHVATVHGLERDADRHFLVME